MKILKSRKTFNSRIHNNQEYDRYLYCTESFNQDDQLLELIDYSGNGDVELVERREYSEGKLVKIHRVNLLFENEELTEYVYRDELLVEEIEYFDKYKFIKTTVSYNSLNKVVSEVKTDKNNKFYGETLYNYSSSESTIEEFDEEGNINYRTILFFNSNNEMVKRLVSTYYYKQGELESEEVETTSFVYSNGNLVKEEIVDSGRVIYRKETNYNSQGDEIEYKIEDHEVDYITKGFFEYNSLNFLISHTKFHGKYNVYSEEIKYDSNLFVLKSIKKQRESDGYISVFQQECENECW